MPRRQERGSLSFICREILMPLGLVAAADGGVILSLPEHRSIVARTTVYLFTASTIALPRPSQLSGHHRRFRRACSEMKLGGGTAAWLLAPAITEACGCCKSVDTYSRLPPMMRRGTSTTGASGLDYTLHDIQFPNSLRSNLARFARSGQIGPVWS